MDLVVLAEAQDSYTATFEMEFEPGELVATAFRGASEIGRTLLRSAETEVNLAARLDRSAIVADDRDLAFVSIELLDRYGTVHAMADRDITVAVDGPGVLQGLGSADPASEGSFLASTCATFDGRALAVIRPTGSGSVTITVGAHGCDPTTVVLQTAAPLPRSSQAAFASVERR